jgi:hypothetical protein
MVNDKRLPKFIVLVFATALVLYALVVLGAILARSAGLTP